MRLASVLEEEELAFLASAYERRAALSREEDRDLGEARDRLSEGFVPAGTDGPLPAREELGDQPVVRLSLEAREQLVERVRRPAAPTEERVAARASTDSHRRAVLRAVRDLELKRDPLVRRAVRRLQDRPELERVTWEGLQRSDLFARAAVAPE